MYLNDYDSEKYGCNCKNNRKRLQKISGLLHDVHRFRNVPHDKKLKQRVPSALLTWPGSWGLNSLLHDKLSQILNKLKDLSGGLRQFIHVRNKIPLLHSCSSSIIFFTFCKNLFSEIIID